MADRAPLAGEPPPPVCVTRWNEARHRSLFVGSALADSGGAIAAAARGTSRSTSSVHHKSAHRKSTKAAAARQSRASSTLAARTSKAYGGRSSVGAGSEGGTGQPAANVAELSYLQLCSLHQVRPNSGLLNTLQGLDMDKGTALTDLDLNGNHLGSRGVSVVFDLVSCSQRLTTLKLSGQQLNAQSLAQLLDVLHTHLSLRSLDLSNNTLSIAAARALSEFASATSTLEGVDVSATHITQEWSDRINTRLKDVWQRRVLGTISEPVYRPLSTHRVVRLLVLASDAASFADELRALDGVLQRVNAVLQTRGVSLLPLVASDAHRPAPSLCFLADAVHAARDSLNENLPWVVAFDNPDADTMGAADTRGGLPDTLARLLRGDDEGCSVPRPSLTSYEAVLRYVESLQRAVPPPAPLRDKNGVQRAPVRREVPNVFLFVRAAAVARGSGAARRLAQGRRCVARCVASRAGGGAAAAPAAGNNDASLSVFASLAASQLMVGFDEVYSPTSESDSAAQVLPCAAAAYPPGHFTAAELYGEGAPVFEEGLPQTLKNQWFVADQLLRNYQGRPAAEQELLGYCERYEPESGVTYPLLVYGQSGTGKATSLARLAKELQREDGPCARVLPLFVGRGRDSTRLTDVLRLLTPAVREAFEMPAVAQATEAHALLAEWRELVSSPVVLTQPRKVVVLLANLEAVEDGEGGLLLPLSLNAHVRVVATLASHEPLLRTLRTRVPQPYELLLTPFDGKTCHNILAGALTSHVPGLSKETGGAAAGDSDNEEESAAEGVITKPSNPPDAVCFKDHGGCPLYLHIAALLLDAQAASLSGAADTLAAVNRLPECTQAAVDALLVAWEAAHGAATVRRVLTFACLRRNGFCVTEVQGVLGEATTLGGGAAATAAAASPAAVSAFVLRLEAVLLRHGDGLCSLAHSELCTGVERRYGLLAEEEDAADGEAVPVERYYAALARQCFRHLAGDSGVVEVYRQDIALAEVVGALVQGGRVLEAYAVVADPSFIERKLQASFTSVVRDCEAVEHAIRRSAEAGVEGFASWQFRPTAEIAMLRAIRRMCVDHEAALRRFPSVLQAALSLPSSSPVYKAVCASIEGSGVPHPLLKWRNKRTRPSLAVSTLDVTGGSEAVLHVAFRPANIDDTSVCALTTRATVYVCSAGTVLNRLAIADSLAAPMDGFLASTFTPDGRLIVTACPTQVVVWDASDKDTPLLHNVMDLAPSMKRCLSHDGQTIVAVQLNTGKGCILDTRTGRIVSTLKPHGIPHDICLCLLCCVLPSCHTVEEEQIRDIFFAASCLTAVSIGCGTVCVYSGKYQVSYGGHQVCCLPHAPFFIPFFVCLSCRASLAVRTSRQTESWVHRLTTRQSTSGQP